ncbi:ESPR-type extended signal peptide-containing protein [uncultured Veillonella sp.]|uniref:ESPR-type extended signal peptide-containing protein n=1 Tax=uncultured Veillonella sp. TaxID=159268 RepID=UPI0028E6D850|nr:ESPR-type extended signal peptide-containing protein [uncultured Veillonella sp.]
MNRIYKVIWSRVKNCYVVVSEIANNRGKINGSGGTGVRTLLCALALVGSVALPLNVAQAVNPAGTGAGVAWGDGTDSGADQHNVAIGGYAKALGTVALSLGAHSESTGAYSTAVGGGSHATAQNAAAIGPWSKASAENAVAVGANAESSGEYAAAIGGGAKAKNEHAIAVGSLSEATGKASLAVGNNSKALNNYAYAIGGSSKATGQWSIAMGTNATAQEDASVAIGTWAEATKGQAMAIGYQARSRAIGATSLGRLSLVNAVDGTAIGSSTSVTGLNGTAIGNKANVSVKNGVAIGNEANVANENAVAIGAGSETAAAVGTASEMINGEVHNFAGVNPGSTVSVGKAGAERTITNVAAGRLSATSTDAVNGSQLYAVNTEVNKGVVYAGDVKAAGANDNKFTQRLGAQTNVVGGVADVSKLSDNNIGVVSNGSNTLNVKLAKELQGLTSVTTGNTVMNTDGVTITGGPKIVKDGIDAGNKQITNVASGGDVITNGANIGDINRIVTAKDKYVTGGTATYQANGDGTANLTGTNGLTANVTGLKNNFVTSGSVSNDGKTLTLERNDTGKVNVDLSNVFTEVAKGDYRLVANPEPNSQGKYKADSDGNMVLTVANDKGDKKQVTLTDIASKAQQDTNTTNITNINNTIAKGLNFAGDTGADINKQLGEKLSIKGGASADLTDNNIGVISDGAQLNVKLKKDVNLGPNGSLTINGKTYVNKDGLNAGGQKITNVAPGTAGTDAVNVDQLNAAIGGTSKATTVKAKDANVTVTEGVNAAGGKEYTVGLGDKVTLGSDADKKVVVDGTTGMITAGDKVTINGTTGDIKAGTVKITGAGTVNELTNRTWDIDNPTVVHGQAATEDQLKHVSDGVKNNKTDITNINNTIAKGLNFKGDDATVINKQLGEQLDIKGGADANKLSDDNIGVVSANGALNVKLSKELKNLTSVTTGNTVMNTDGLTITGGPKIVKDGIDAGSKKITNVAAGTDNTDAVNFGQLKDAVAAGKTILKDGKNTTVEGDGSANNPYKVNVNDDLVLGKKGADGKDGSIGVNGKDGSAVVINGKDGSIGLNGKDGANGISIKGGDGKPGVDGTNITRLVIEEKNGEKHDVATLDDGMMYGGDTGAVIKKKLNGQVNVVGGITDVNKLTTDDNIGVVSDGANNLKARLAKDLKGLNSVTTGNTVMNTDGLTINGGPKIVKDGIDAGGKKITNVAAGTDNTDAVNFGQLKDAVAAGKTILKDGKNTTVEGDGSANNPYKVNVNDDLVLGKKGADGKDGSIGVNGKDGSAVVINGKDGSIGLNGKDGANGISIKGGDGKPGVDGTNITRLVIEEKNGDKHDVATLDDGMKYGGDTGAVIKKKLNEQVNVVGGITDVNKLTTDDNIGVVSDGANNLKVRLAKDLKGLNSVTTGDTVMNSDGLTINGGPKIVKDGIDAGGKKITNVAEGTNGTDAVNVNQLSKAVAGATTKLENGKNTTVTSTTNNDGSKTYKVNLNDDITLGTDPDKQISIKGSEGTIQAGKVTINGTGGTVNNLTNKTWDPDNITSGQAATEDQLKLVSNEVGKHSSVSEGSNISVTKGTNANGGVDYKVSVIDTPTFKSVTTGNTVMNNSGLTIKNGPSITETGIDAGNKKITNVAAGTADTDAVNVSQLKQIGGNIKNIDSRVNRVGAGAAALAALHPLDFDPDDKLDIAAGYGNYKDAHAVSIGAFYRPNEDTLFSVGGSFGGGENMLNAGVSLKLGQGNHVSTSRVAMAKELKDLRAELENMKGALMKVSEGKQLNSLDLDKMQLFPDVPENHWAYDYVATLAGNGIIVGYPDGKFGGDRMMTRYEMAALIYRAIQNGAVADEQMARALKEFQPELERIRVDTISKHKDGTPDIQRVRVIKGRG